MHNEYQQFSLQFNVQCSIHLEIDEMNFIQLLYFHKSHRLLKIKQQNTVHKMIFSYALRVVDSDATKAMLQMHLR